MEEPRKLTSELIAAIEALQERGIPTTEAAVARWIEEHEPKPARAPKPPYRAPQVATGAEVKTIVAPAQVAPFTPAELQGLAEASQPKPARRNLGGRPAREEPWLEPVAELVADGMTLREALDSLGVSFTEQRLNNIQRLVRFRHFLEKYRQGR